MQIDLECKCTATHKWVLVARFKHSLEAAEAARALSGCVGVPYRTVDRRWPDEGVSVYLFDKGSEVFA